jgi:hypothetical protein
VCLGSFEFPRDHSTVGNQAIPLSIAFPTLVAVEKAGRLTMLAGIRLFIAHSNPSFPTNSTSLILRSFVSTTRTVQGLVIIVDCPLSVVREFGIASFEFLKFT